MKTFTLKNKFQTNATLVANDFIDHYMVQANGEFVKVYLFLLRHLDNAGSSLTVSAVADCLNNTENDILRAFKYWESKGLLQMECDAEGHVCELELIQTSPDPSTDTDHCGQKAFRTGRLCQACCSQSCGSFCFPPGGARRCRKGAKAAKIAPVHCGTVSW